MAVQVLVMVNSCGQLPPTVASLKATIGAASQLSVAVAEPVAAGKVFDPHSMVTFAGHVIPGARLSSTTMVCAHELELPQSSVATQVRVMVLS